MTKYLAHITKSILMTAVVEATTKDEAYSASIDYDHIVDVQDCGWDIIWDVEVAGDKDVTCYTKEELKVINEQGLIY